MTAAECVHIFPKTWTTRGGQELEARHGSLAEADEYKLCVLPPPMNVTAETQGLIR